MKLLEGSIDHDSLHKPIEKLNMIDLDDLGQYDLNSSFIANKFFLMLSDKSDQKLYVRAH